MAGTAQRRPMAQSQQSAFALGGEARASNAVEVATQNAAPARRATALELMAQRLNIDPGRLKATLQATVFRVKDTNNDWRSCTDEEFAALIIVANEYGLNPLTKQIYAFPAKGGGIVPVVSVDGWIHLMNSHPQFDGIEFNDIADDKGGLLAIETVIYRKDRSRPIRVTEYLDECRRKTDPWDKSPARMLRHKSLIQCNRIAFGFSGIHSEDDAEVISDWGMDDAALRNVSPPRRDEALGYDETTGEIHDDAPEIQTDAQNREIDPREAKAEEIIRRAGEVVDLDGYNALAEEAQPHIDAMTDEDMAGACHRALRAARARVMGQ